MRSWLSRTLAVILLVPGLSMVAFVDASAAVCHSQGSWVKAIDSRASVYKVVKRCTGQGQATKPSATTKPSAGGKVAPACDLTSPATYCVGSIPCYDTASVVPYLPPATKPPTPDSEYHIQVCFEPENYTATSLVMGFGWLGTAVWNGQPPQPPSLVNQAMEARGQIVPPAATLSFNPTARTLVNLDTWFWAQGLTRQELRGTSAFGLVAFATPDRLVVTPGDGSAPFTCPWVTGKSDRCSYPYRRSSVGGSVVAASGAPAYQASAKATWKLRFEKNGEPVTIPEAPGVLTGPAMTVPVEVAEVQTLVTGTG